MTAQKEVERLRAALGKLLEITESYIHDAYDGTSMVSEMLEELDFARDAISNPTSSCECEHCKECEFWRARFTSAETPRLEPSTKKEESEVPSAKREECIHRWVSNPNDANFWCIDCGYFPGPRKSPHPAPSGKEVAQATPEREGATLGELVHCQKCAGIVWEQCEDGWNCCICGHRQR